MYEVSVAINVAENTQPGNLISVAESETILPVAVPAAATPSEQARLFMLSIHRQMELRVATMMEEVKERAIDQLQAHQRLIEDGTHSNFFQDGG
jgi:hypothetical protein